jgi:hypothetical protein
VLTYEQQDFQQGHLPGTLAEFGPEILDDLAADLQGVESRSQRGG